MHIYPNSVGEYAPDGSIRVEASVCPLTGVPVLEQHHVVQRLDATHFVRVLSQQYPNLTEDVRAELLASVTPAKSTRAKVTADAEKEQQHGD